MRNFVKSSFRNIAKEDMKIDYQDCVNYVQHRYNKRTFIKQLKHFVKVFYRIDTERTGEITFEDYWFWRKAKLVEGGVKADKLDGWKETMQEKFEFVTGGYDVSTWQDWEDWLMVTHGIVCDKTDEDGDDDDYDDEDDEDDWD